MPEEKPQTALLTPFSKLADFYQKAGFSRFSEEIVPRIIMLEQQSGWAGRRIMELGCGVGTVSIWLADKGFRVTGVDISNAMLNKARLNAQTARLGIRWMQQDIRDLDYSEGTLDLVLSINVLNLMRNPDELKHVFQHASRVLSPGRLFAFDMYTIQGLAERWGTNTHFPYDNRQDLTVIIRSHFSYEVQGNTLRYIIFHRPTQSPAWERVEEVHTLRTYPTHLINAWLEEAGFSQVHIYNTALSAFDVSADTSGRAIFVAEKAGG